LEINVSEQWATCERLVSDYEVRAKQLQLLPAEALNARGHDYSLTVHANADGLPSLSQDTRGELKANLESFVSMIRANEMEFWSDLLNTQTEIDALTDDVKGIAFSIKSAEAEFQRVDAIRQQRKTRLEEELGKKLDQLESLKTDLANRRKFLEERAHKSNDDKLSAERAFESLDFELRQRHLDYYQRTMATLDQLMSYKAHVKDALAEYKTHLEKVLETSK